MEYYWKGNPRWKSVGIGHQPPQPKDTIAEAVKLAKNGKPVLPVLNIAAYRFVPLDDPAALRASLLLLARGCRLRGTILLAEEGINFFLAGEPSGAHAFLTALRADPRFAGLEAKESWSAHSRSANCWSRSRPKSSG